MDNVIEIIRKVIEAKTEAEFIDSGVFEFEDGKLSPSQVKEILKSIHPDICSLPGAAEATSKLNVWKDYFEEGKVFRDDAGEFKTNGFWLRSNNPGTDDKLAENIEWSIQNYDILSRSKPLESIHFRKYIPLSIAIETGAMNFEFTFEKRSVPLSGLQLPQEHVNWILNRLLEYCTYLSQYGNMSHCGLNPESVFIVPETHGIQICSFYHMTKFGNKIGTISGKYSHWYPASVFQTKIASAAIDIECSKKIAAYLLGDPSGTGVRLKKTHNEAFINFIVKQHTNAFEALEEYRAILAANFEKKFHHLSL
jgi:hypothetical protein